MVRWNKDGNIFGGQVPSTIKVELVSSTLWLICNLK
jgi:hypothetical protein